jgi:hypothetical protein
MRGTDEIFKCTARCYGFDANRNDRQSLTDGPFDLPFDLRGSVGIVGKYQDKNAGAFDGVDDRFAIVAPGTNVFISYSSQDKPTADAACAALEAANIRCWIAPRDIRSNGTRVPLEPTSFLHAWGGPRNRLVLHCQLTKVLLGYITHCDETACRGDAPRGGRTRNGPKLLKACGSMGN